MKGVRLSLLENPQQGLVETTKAGSYFEYIGEVCIWRIVWILKTKMETQLRLFIFYEVLKQYDGRSLHDRIFLVNGKQAAEMEKASIENILPKKNRKKISMDCLIK